MCGILGLITTDRDYLKNKAESFNTALSKLAHRGPDNTNIFSDSRSLIGFNRLAIVGSDQEVQPFISENKKIVVVCNGEIYNHLELKNDRYPV